MNADFRGSERGFGVPVPTCRDRRFGVRRQSPDLSGRRRRFGFAGSAATFARIAFQNFGIWNLECGDLSPLWIRGERGGLRPHRAGNARQGAPASRTPKAFTNYKPRVARISALPWEKEKTRTQPLKGWLIPLRFAVLIARGALIRLAFLNPKLEFGVRFLKSRNRMSLIKA